MSAEVLREAAALMRERAGEPVAQPDLWPNVVAAAVADWLHACADLYADPADRILSEQAMWDYALAVANAYLGEPT